DLGDPAVGAGAQVDAGGTEEAGDFGELHGGIVRGGGWVGQSLLRFGPAVGKRGSALGLVVDEAGELGRRHATRLGRHAVQDLLHGRGLHAGDHGFVDAVADVVGQALG